MPQFYDFYSPVMSAAIVTVDNNRFPLWSYQAGGQGQVTLPPPRYGANNSPLTSLSYLTELTVVLDLGNVPRITAVLQPPYRDAINLLDSEIIEFGQSTLEVLLGYSTTTSSNATLSPVFSGILLKPDVQLGTDTTVTLNAQGVGYSMQHQGVASNDDYAHQSRLEVMPPVVERHKELTAGVNSSDAAAYAVSNALLFNRKNSWSQGSNKDWVFLYNLARDAQCWMINDGRSILLLPRDSSTLAKPRFKLAFYEFAQGLVGGGILYPILSASSTTGAVWLPGMRGLFMQGVDYFSKEVVKKSVNDALNKTARVASGPGGSGDVKGTDHFPDANQTNGDGLMMYPGNPGDLAAVAQAQAAFGTLQQAMGINLDVETLGIPDIQPGSVVSIDGLSTRFNHNYSVHRITHVVNSSGFTTQLHLISNTADLIAQQFKAVAEGQENSQQADTSQTGNVSVSPVGDQGTKA